MTATITGSGIDKVLPGAVTRDKLPAGTVLQVVQGTNTGSITTTSTSLVTTGFSASITPTSSSSKVLVIFNGRVYVPNAGNEMTVAIYRGGSSIDAGYTAYSAAGSIAATQSLSILDSPATTSSITYTMYFRSASGASVYININGANDGVSTITLMEIAA